MKRRDLLRLFADALAAVEPGSRVTDALGAPIGAPVHVIAIGKAAPAMAAGAMAAWGACIERCLVVAPDGTDVSALSSSSRARGRASGDGVVVIRAAHPLPDARSVRAADACLAAAGAASAAGADLLVLVSGGASALVCGPSPGITLAKKRAVTRAMLGSGASVQEVNVVRKHLSRIKGGGLARAAAPSRVTTLVASDVIGGAASDVGSGPSVADGSTATEARRLLARFAPSLASVPLVATYRGAVTKSPKSTKSTKSTKAPRTRIVVSPEELAREVASRLRAQGLAVKILPPSQAPVAALAAEYASLARRRTPRVYVRVAEPSVAIPSAAKRRAGRGGRSTHLAALVGQALGALIERDPSASAGARGRIIFAAFATDGVDGSSDSAGAIVDGSFVSRVAQSAGKTALERALDRFDTGTIHRAIGTAIPARPTGHNLADLHVLVVA